MLSFIIGMKFCKSHMVLLPTRSNKKISRLCYWRQGQYQTTILNYQQLLEVLHFWSLEQCQTRCRHYIILDCNGLVVNVYMVNLVIYVIIKSKMLMLLHLHIVKGIITCFCESHKGTKQGGLEMLFLSKEPYNVNEMLHEHVTKWNSQPPWVDLEHEIC
jgi:hypothetical protein